MDDPTQAAVLEALEQASMTVDLVAGYRAKCVAIGFNETAAEVMAVQFHSVLMALWAKSLPG